MKFDRIGKENNKRVEFDPNKWSLRRYTLSELKHLQEVSVGENNRYVVRSFKPDTWTNYHYSLRPSNQPIYSEQQIDGYEIKDSPFFNYEIPKKYDLDPYQAFYCNENTSVFTNEVKPEAKPDVSVFAHLSIRDTKGYDFQKDKCIASQTFQRLPSKLRYPNWLINPIEKEEDQKNIGSQEQDKKTWVCCHCTKRCKATERGGHCMTKIHLDYLETKVICPTCLHQSKLAQEEMIKKKSQDAKR